MVCWNWGQFIEDKIVVLQCRRKELISLIIFAEILRVIASVLLIFSASFYLRHLEKTKKHRKLSTFEFTMHIIIQVAYGLFAISLLISVFIN